MIDMDMHKHKGKQFEEAVTLVHVRVKWGHLVAASSSF